MPKPMIYEDVDSVINIQQKWGITDSVHLSICDTYSKHVTSNMEKRLLYKTS